MEMKGYYAVARYVPDAFRGEGVNLGVMLLCPEARFLEWRFTANHHRARRFFKYEVDVGRLKLLTKGLEARLREDRTTLIKRDALDAFIARQKDRLQLTALRSCAVVDADEELRRLYERLVEPLSAERVRVEAMDSQQVRSFVTERLQSAQLLCRLQQNVEFTAKYRTRPYQFSFGYRNGDLKIIHATSFAYKYPDDGCERAAVLLSSIDDVRQHQTDSNPKFSVVGAFDSKQIDVIKAVRMQFQERRVELFTVDEVDAIVTKVREDLLRSEPKPIGSAQ